VPLEEIVASWHPGVGRMRGDQARVSALLEHDPRCCLMLEQPTSRTREKRHMSPRSLIFAAVACLLLAATSAPALAQDAQICMAAAERVADGETLSDCG